MSEKKVIFFKHLKLAILVAGLLLVGCQEISASAASEKEIDSSVNSAEPNSVKDATATDANKVQNENSSEESKSTVLQGGVKGTAVHLTTGLSMIELSAKMLQGSTLEIAKEVTRKETVVVKGPNYIGNGIVLPAIGGPNGTMQMGNLPARRDKIERFLATAEDSLKALQSQVDGLIIHDEAAEDILNLWRGMRSTMQVSITNMDKMRELLANQTKEEIPPSQAKQIGRAAMKVYDSMSALESMRTKLLDLIEPAKK